MATATMGLRRRVQVSTSVAQSSSGSSSSGSSNKRTRSENNNSPSQGNLNSLGSEPAPKKTRTSTGSRSAASKAKDVDLSKKVSVSNTGPPHWSDPRPYASIAGLSLGAQAALCSAEAVGLPSPIPYMSTTMATFVGNATNLGKSPSVSYLDISNMTARPPGWPTSDSSASPTAHDTKSPLNLPYAAGALAGSYTSGSKSQSNQASSQSSPLALSESTATQAAAAGAQVTLPKNFPNDSMFNTYQPWVIKTYGDLAKTKTVTIKKYARILRTLRGEEVNSAENSKFRFWVKSKGFHIGQPEGYDPKPADRIIGRHAVTNPGLDPPLYVPTQPPHNKALNGAEGTIPPGRVYKKVAIVENFFDIIHAVHVDLEGRPGKHAGQKRTYRTITETYAFLPREAVTRFLLGCTECQRRPRTPSPTSLAAAQTTTSTTTITTPTSSTTLPLATPTTSNDASASAAPGTPSSPKPAQAPSPDLQASNPPETKSLVQPQEKEPVETAEETTKTVAPATPSPQAQSSTESSTAGTATTTTTTTSSTITLSNTITTTNNNASRMRDERYNPLSITNLLRKDPITRRPPLPIVTTVIQSFPEPVISPPVATITGTTPTSEPSAGPNTSNTTTNSSYCYPRKMRMLPEEHGRGSTPSPVRPWSPGPEAKCAPIDYSLPMSGSYPKQQEATSEGSGSVGSVGSPASSSSESESEAEEERGFSPAAGLIDTNLNLLATIQELHCQVMLALTERLRPPTSTGGHHSSLVRTTRTSRALPHDS